MDHITHPRMQFTGNWSMTSIWMIWHVKSRGILNPHREEKQPSGGLACTVVLGPGGQQCCPWPAKQFLSPSPSWNCEALWGVSQDLHPLGYLAAHLFGQKDWLSGPTSTSIPSSGVITNWASLCDLHLLRELTQCLSKSWQTFLKRKPGLIFSEADPCLLTFLLTLGKFNIIWEKKALAQLYSYTTGLSATWSSDRCLCPWQGGWTSRSLKVPSNPNHPGTLPVPAIQAAMQNQTREESIKFANGTDLFFFLTFSLFSSDCLPSQPLITFRTRFLIKVPNKQIGN